MFLIDLDEQVLCEQLPGTKWDGRTLPQITLNEQSSDDDTESHEESNNNSSACYEDEDHNEEDEFNRKRKLCTYKSKSLIRFIDGTTRHIPRVIKRDIRRTIPQLMAKAFNSFDLHHFYHFVDGHRNKDFSFFKSLNSQKTDHPSAIYEGNSVDGFIYSIYSKYMSAPDMIMSIGNSSIVIKPDDSCDVETYVECSGTMTYALPEKYVQNCFVSEMALATANKAVPVKVTKKAKVENEDSLQLESYADTYYKKNKETLKSLGIYQKGLLPIAPVEAIPINPPQRVSFRGKQIVQFDKESRIQRIMYFIDVHVL